MGIFSIIGSALKPLVKLVDDVHTSTEEKLELKAVLDKIANDLAVAGMEHDRALAEAQASIIIAEAKSGSWITRSWRPLMMMMFGVLIMLIATGLMDVEALAAVPDKLWNLISIGLGGYIVGRSAEKTIPKILEAQKKKQEAG